MRSTKLGGNPKQINPLIPSELVIDHSVQVDVFGRADALELNGKIEFERNMERYSFLRWGQKSLENFKVVPPNTGIVHQVNLENLARVVMEREVDGELLAFPDTVFGTDSHTTMINGIGVLGWGVGGIEAEAAMLGQPSSMLIPQVVGFKLTGKLPEGTTATDLVLTVTQMLRALGVVGKFVEFYGDGLQHLPLADRATISNMAPEYGATCGIFPIDAEALTYLRLSGRSEEQIALVEAYAKAQGLWHDADSPHATYSATLELDLADVKPSLAGPKRPQDRVLLEKVKDNFHANLEGLIANRPARKTEVKRMDAEGGDQPQAEHLAAKPKSKIRIHDQDCELTDGSVVIAAITSCTNTSNPAVMLGAGLLARNAVRLGPQGQAVGQDLARPGLAGGHRLPEEGRRARRPGEARLLRRRLRLHHLHRQLRPAAGRSVQGHRRERPGRGLGAVGQPQLRRPRALRSEDELPRLAAAGGRLCARRHGRHRPDQRTARPHAGRQGRVPARHLADRTRKSATPSPPPSARNCSRRTTPTCSRATAAGTRSPRRKASRSCGTRPRPTSRTRPTSTA